MNIYIHRFVIIFSTFQLSTFPPFHLFTFPPFHLPPFHLSTFHFSTFPTFTFLPLYLPPFHLFPFPPFHLPLCLRNVFTHYMYYRTLENWYPVNRCNFCVSTGTWFVKSLHWLYIHEYIDTRFITACISE